MNKIKKIKDLTFDKEDMSTIVGAITSGCEYDCCNVASINRVRLPTTTPSTPQTPTPHCRCGCSGCSYQDG
jgi:hypothetical protein